MSGEKATILIVAWDDMDLIGYCEAIEEQGFAAIAGWTLEDAAEALREQSVDLALLAVHHRSGETSLAFGEALTRTGVPVVFFSEKTGEDHALPPAMRAVVQQLPMGNAAMMKAIREALGNRVFLDPTGPAWVRATQRQ